MNKEYYSQIPNDLILDKNDLYKKYTYIILAWEYIYTNTNRLGECKFLVSDMVEEFGYKSNPAKNKINDKFIESIQVLYKNNLLEELDIIKDKKQYRCVPKMIDSNYFKLKRMDRIKIFNNSGKDKVNILKIFCYLSARMYKRSENQSINYSFEVCFPSYNQIERETGISEGNIKKYIESLKENQLIAYKSAGIKINKDTKERTYCRNTYAFLKEGWEEEIDRSISYYKDKFADKFEFIKNNIDADNVRLYGEKGSIIKKIKNNKASKKDFRRLKEIEAILSVNEESEENVKDVIIRDINELKREILNDDITINESDRKVIEKYTDFNNKNIEELKEMHEKFKVFEDELY